MQTISNSWKHSGFVLMVSIETWIYSRLSVFSGQEKDRTNALQQMRILSISVKSELEWIHKGQKWIYYREGKKERSDELFLEIGWNNRGKQLFRSFNCFKCFKVGLHFNSRQLFSPYVTVYVCSATLKKKVGQNNFYWCLTAPPNCPWTVHQDKHSSLMKSNITYWWNV